MELDEAVAIDLPASLRKSEEESLRSLRLHVLKLEENARALRAHIAKVEAAFGFEPQPFDAGTSPRTAKGATYPLPAKVADALPVEPEAILQPRRRRTRRHVLEVVDGLRALLSQTPMSGYHAIAETLCARGIKTSKQAVSDRLNGNPEFQRDAKFVWSVVPEVGAPAI